MISKKSWVLFLAFSLIFFQIVDLQSQVVKKNIEIDWQEPLSFLDEDGQLQRLLYFKGSISHSDYTILPSYFERFPLATPAVAYRVELEGAHYLPLSPEEVALIPDTFSFTSCRVSATVAVERKKSYLCLSLLPIRCVGKGRYEKLERATISIYAEGEPKHAAPAKNYATHSLLASGRWYKVGAKSSGIYQITYEDMLAMGIVAQPIASSRVSLFGNGGTMLPESNAAFRYDDITELPIAVYDGGDGMFGAGDYLIFYAEGPHDWCYYPADRRYHHRYNLYHNEACFFLNVEGKGSTKRIVNEDNRSLQSTVDVTTFDAFGFFEQDLVHIGEGGRNWYGDKFDATTEYTYTLALPAPAVGEGRLTLAVAAASARVSSFSVALNGQQIGRLSVPSITSNDWARAAENDFPIFPSTVNSTLTLKYEKPTYSSMGYLNYLEWQVPCRLAFSGAQMPFCHLASVAPNAVVRYQVQSTLPLQVWDITHLSDVKQMVGDWVGSTFQFKAAHDSLRHFMAFNENDLRKVSFLGFVAPQNLHGTSQVDMVIVAHPDFITHAEQLAEFRRQNDGLSVKVVTPQQVYNEFSSGAQDITAIRDYMRMIYDKSNGRYPRYLLLFGRPSYDYRQIEGLCKLYVPNYQSVSAMNDNSLRANDDYFALLDEGEGENCVGMLDLAVGRFPVSSAEQAAIAVRKTKEYSTSDRLDDGLSSNYGDWKNMVAFVADDEDGTTHISAADRSATLAQSHNPNINIDKIYLDAYQQVNYSASERYPDVTKDINHRMNRGCLLFAYVGHGGKYGWAAERVIELSDIRSWHNRYALPWMITLTCEFGWYDRQLVSPAELAFFNDKGGVAGLVTTSRVAFTGSNQQYAINFYSHIFDQREGRPLTIGEINQTSKNLAGGATSSLNMLYVLGDPSMKLKLPTYQVLTDSINGVAVHSFTDTLKALDRVTIAGHIADASGMMLSDFNGTLFPSIYDKKMLNHTLQNDENSYYFEFEEQNNILFKGNVSVQNGRFNFSFILPKDINYTYGQGKFSYYATAGNRDAAGSYAGAHIGGISSSSIVDNEGPQVEIYMNDEHFVSGGIVNPSPTLLLKLRDNYGINTTGNGIGHDLVAVLDDGEQTVLNDYYVAERDSFNCGTVRYPYANLAPGKHTLKVRVWDILNNLTESQIDFVVASEEGLRIDHVLNYPNPFTTHTDFYFEHNQPATTLEVVISIFTISGKLVKTLSSTQVNDGFRSNPISWDGRDDYGDKLGKGTYIYRLKVRTPDGRQAEKIEKIVLL